MLADADGQGAAWGELQVYPEAFVFSVQEEIALAGVGRGVGEEEVLLEGFEQGALAHLAFVGEGEAEAAKGQDTARYEQSQEL